MTAARSYLFLIFQALSVIFLTVLCLPVLLFGQDAVRNFAKFWARLNLHALRMITGIDYVVEGTEHIPQDGCIVACNHQSMFETLALFAELPKPVIIFKQELLNIPLFGAWIKAAGNVAIDRKGGATALRTMRNATRNAVANGGQVVVFPEGTRVKPGETKKFQSGIAGLYKTAGSICAPIAHDSGRFWIFPGHEKRPGVVTLRFLPSIAPGLEKRAFLQKVQTTIEDGRPDLAPQRANPQDKREPTTRQEATTHA